MPNPNRFGASNAALAEANTKLILNLLAKAPHSIAELQVATNFTRVTIDKRLKANKDIIKFTDTHPRKYYIADASKAATVIDEIVAKEKQKETKATRTEGVRDQAVKNASVHGNADVVFFPQATHNDLSVVHDNLMNTEKPDPVQIGYTEAKSLKDLEVYEHKIKVMYDMIQFRRKLKGEFE